MADFVAVLKKTLKVSDETTPEMRERVYDEGALDDRGKLLR